MALGHGEAALGCREITLGCRELAPRPRAVARGQSTHQAQGVGPPGPVPRVAAPPAPLGTGTEALVGTPDPKPGPKPSLKPGSCRH